MRAPLILILLFLACPALGGPKEIAYKIYERFRRTYSRNSQPCTLVTNMNLDTEFIPMTIFTHEDESPLVLEKMTKHLRATSWCSIGIFANLEAQPQVDLRTIKNLVRRVMDYAMVTIGTKPSPEELAAMEREVFWVETVQSDLYLFHVFCGRKQGAFWRFNITFWSPGYDFVHLLDFHDACPSPLLNQNLKVGENGIKPMIIPPEEGSGREVRGTDINCIRFLAKRFDMNLEFESGSVGLISLANRNATGFQGDLLNNKMDIVTPSALNLAGMELFDNTRFTFHMAMRYTTRHPRKLLAIGNVARGFDPLSWVGVFAFLAIFSIMFSVIFWVYKYVIGDKSLYRDPSSPFDFVLMTYTTFVEPDPLPWFPKWSTGRMVVFLWSMFAFLMVSFFNSNLRTNLIAPSLEPKIDTTEDFLKSGREIYAHYTAYYITGLNPVGRVKEVLELLRSEPQRFYPNPGMTILQVNEAIQNDGAVIIAFMEILILNYLSTPKYEGLPNQRPSSEVINSNFMTIRLQQFSPITPYLNNIIERVHESGLYFKFLYEFVPVVAMPGQYIRGQEDTAEIRMNLEMILTPMITLGVGTVLGLIVFIMEQILYRFKKKRISDSEVQPH